MEGRKSEAYIAGVLKKGIQKRDRLADDNAERLFIGFSLEDAAKCADIMEALCHNNNSISLWQLLAKEGINPGIIKKLFVDLLSKSIESDRKFKLDVAAFYVALLALPNSPASGLFDEVAWSCTISLVCTLFAKEKRATCIMENMCTSLQSRLTLTSFPSTVTTSIERLAPLTREIVCIDNESQGLTCLEKNEEWRRAVSSLYKLLQNLNHPRNTYFRQACVVLMRSIQPVLSLQVNSKKALLKTKLQLREYALSFLNDFVKSHKGGC